MPEMKITRYWDDLKGEEVKRYWKQIEGYWIEITEEEYNNAQS